MAPAQVIKTSMTPQTVPLKTLTIYALMNDLTPEFKPLMVQIHCHYHHLECTS